MVAQKQNIHNTTNRNKLARRTGIIPPPPLDEKGLASVVYGVAQKKKALQSGHESKIVRGLLRGSRASSDNKGLMQWLPWHT